MTPLNECATWIQVDSEPHQHRKRSALVPLGGLRPDQKKKHKGDPMSTIQTDLHQSDEDVESLVHRLQTLTLKGGSSLNQRETLVSLLQIQTVGEGTFLRYCSSDWYASVITFLVDQGKVTHRGALLHAACNDMPETLESLWNAASLSRSDKDDALQKALEADAFRVVLLVEKKRLLPLRAADLLERAKMADAWWCCKQLTRLIVLRTKNDQVGAVTTPKDWSISL